jgi:hypothetical protein
MTDPRHEPLHEIVKKLPSDFEPWGERSREEDWGPDCSCGCRWYVPLEPDLQYDWGICYSAQSPRCGLLTNQGCRKFEATEDNAEEEDWPEWLAGKGKTQMERPAEVALLKSLHLRHRELKALLKKSNDHWGFEDPVYRFYHQSFKVCGLQEKTKAIVSKLDSLAPDRSLNPWFLKIVAAGTGKQFKQEDNTEWPRVTRPIPEAFFHAKFFLEMAVRYAYIPVPPLALPSGMPRCCIYMDYVNYGLPPRR